MLKPICVPCQRFFRVKKNGFAFVENMPIVAGAEPGTAEPENWKPYKLWVGDLWSCNGCGANIVVGVGGSAIVEHFQPNFEEQARRLGATLDVNDC